MKNILILSCSTGEGHNSAAKAIATALSDREIACQIVDPVGVKSARAKKIVASVYNETIKRAPSAFNAIYKLGAAYSATKLPSPIYYANKLYADDLHTFIVNQGFDCVISTHLYGMEAMTAINKKAEQPIPTYGVLTDYTCIPFFRDVVMDGYFIPHDDLRREIISAGIEEDKIFPTGIPVDKKFGIHTERAEARRLLDLPADGPIYLIMGGGVGCGNPEEMCGAFLTQTQNALACVFVGKNTALLHRLKERYPQEPRLRFIPFTDRVNLYMNAADVMISKAGGLSSTEAAVAGIPLVHLLVYTACEAKNVSFFQEHGMSVRANNIGEAVSEARKLVESPERSAAMRAAQRENCNQAAAEAIVKVVMG